jgi:hypothetical protein
LTPLWPAQGKAEVDQGGILRVLVPIDGTPITLLARVLASETVAAF